jgi:hypothetical protein
MSKTVLVTRPRHDPITNYLYYWSTELLKMANQKGMDVFDLAGEKATRKNFESYACKQPSLVFMNGHGNADTITGDSNKPIVDKKSSIKTSVIYARSCDSAAALGQILVSGATKAFIGYKRKFVMVYLPTHMHKPLNDPLARLFLEPSNLAVSTILKGHTVQEANLRSKRAMNKNFQRMVSSQASDEEKYAARWVWANMNSQVVLGNPNAKI